MECLTPRSVLPSCYSISSRSRDKNSIQFSSKADCIFWEFQQFQGLKYEWIQLSAKVKIWDSYIIFVAVFQQNKDMVFNLFGIEKAHHNQWAYLLSFGISNIKHIGIEI